VWSVEMALSHSDSLTKYTPEEAKRYWPSAGNHWRINFSRVEDKGRLNWTWCPQIVWDPESGCFRGKVAMHLPDAWGYVQFVEDISEKNRDTTPASSNAQNNERDPTWPHRLAAMNIYYAQRYFKSHHGEGYARTVAKLEQFLRQDIVEPFAITINASKDRESYTAFVEQGGIRAVINDERLVSIDRYANAAAG
jgi:hypothetical protein